MRIRSFLQAILRLPGCLAIVIGAFTQGYAMAEPPDCASLATTQYHTWNITYSPGGVWSLTLAQDAQGNITGAATRVDSSCTATTEAMTGTAEGGGGFSLTQNPNNTDGCGWVKMDLSIPTGVSCAQASGIYDAEQGPPTGSVTLAQPSADGPIIPSGETASVFVGGVSGAPTTGEYEANLSPTTYNFEGRTITESFPDGIVDGCDSNPGSPQINPPSPTSVYPLVNGHGSNENQLGSPQNGVTTGYADEIGLPSVGVTEIRNAYDAPCTISMEQQLAIDDIQASGGNASFEVNYNTITINANTITTTRNYSSPTTWQYLSVSQLFIPLSLSLVLE